MPRLIVLLITLASLTTVTVQNFGSDKAVPLVVLGTPLASISLGLLLLCAVGTGALITLLLYALIGLYRPVNKASQSKYQPMGSRIPYSETSSNPSAPQTASSYSTYGSSTAFVTEPPTDRSFVDRAGASSASEPSPASTGSFDAPNSPQASNQPGDRADNPAASSNVYSPFSREQDITAKKKGSTAQ